MRLWLLLPFLCLAACATDDKLSREYLRPSPTWAAEPKDLGLAAVECSIPVGGDVALHAWLIPAEGARGRTVVLLHDRTANNSQLHPYYAFLQRAGLNVFVFDYRGYGRSTGRPSFHAAANDLRLVLDFVRSRPEVDRNQVALFGQGLGAVLALHAAAWLGPVRALVLENLYSPSASLRADAEEQGADSPALSAGMLEYLWLPEHLEPEENAGAIATPMLLLSGGRERAVERQAALRTSLAAKDAQLWVLPDTGPAPEPLLTHAVDYERLVTGFLTGELGGQPERVRASGRRIGPAERGIAYEVTVRRSGPPLPGKWAAQVCALDAQAGAQWRSAVVDGDAGTVRLELEHDASVFTATRLTQVEMTAEGFTEPANPLAAAATLWRELQPAIATLRKEPKADLAHATAQQLAAAEKAPFPRAFECQLAELFWLLGRTLAASPDATDKAQGLNFLRRAANGTPEQPKLHVWLAAPASIGFPHHESVQKAKEMLQKLEGR